MFFQLHVYEYRKAIFKKNVDTVVIYKTTPFCKIIGEFEIDGILYDTPVELLFCHLH